ncbi:MAG: YqjF family protein [Ktedonobacteraceae bacterium]
MDTKAILGKVDHRPFPMPGGPWIMTQIWNTLLFAHWPLAPEILRPLVPSVLPLDTFDRQCWVGLTPFYMTHVRPRGFPPIPRLSQFPEMNVRTYVVVHGIPGVYFFSLDAGNPLAVALARALFHLPYYHAGMSCKRAGEIIHYRSWRAQLCARPAEFVARYRPLPPVFSAQRGSLEYWLVERYCLYTTLRDRVYRAHIHHRPWPLQAAELELERNTMALASDIHLPATRPLLHYAHRQEVLVWPLQRVL